MKPEDYDEISEMSFGFTIEEFFFLTMRAKEENFESVEAFVKAKMIDCFKDDLVLLEDVDLESYEVVKEEREYSDEVECEEPLLIIKKLKRVKPNHLSDTILPEE